MAGFLVPARKMNIQTPYNVSLSIQSLQAFLRGGHRIREALAIGAQPRKEAWIWN
jgi:hypothetical protein